jgi:hypothetical protein
MPDLAGFQMITGFQIQGFRDWYVKKQNVLHCKTFVKVCFTEAASKFIITKPIS